MDKFNIKKITAQLNKLNRESGKDINAGIVLISNNLEIYNTLLVLFIAGDLKQIYLLYQMSATIYKQLEKFNIFPNKKELNEKEDGFTTMKKNIENR